MLGKNVFGVCKLAFDDGFNLLVDFGGDLIGIGFGRSEISAQEHLIVILAVNNGSKLIAHTVFHNHLLSDFGGALNVVGSAGGYVLLGELFGNPSAKQRADLLNKLGFGGVSAIVRGTVHCISCRHSAGNN